MVQFPRSNGTRYRVQRSGTSIRQKGFLKEKQRPFSGWKPEIVEEKVTDAEIIDFPKKGITSLLKSGEVKVGKAPKTKKSTLDAKKGVLDKQISKEMRIKEIQRENKEAIERFRKKMEEPDPKFHYNTWNMVENCSISRRTELTQPIFTMIVRLMTIGE